MPEGIFKPKPTAIETRYDATTKAARDIIDNEATARESKTERLKAARLAEEAKAAKAAPAPKIAAKRKRAPAKGAAVQQP